MRLWLRDPRHRRLFIFGAAGAAVLLLLVLRRRSSAATTATDTSAVGPLVDPSSLTNGLPSSLDGGVAAGVTPAEGIVLEPGQAVYDPNTGQIVSNPIPATPDTSGTDTGTDTPTTPAPADTPAVPAPSSPSASGELGGTASRPRPPRFTPGGRIAVPAGTQQQPPQPPPPVIPVPGGSVIPGTFGNYYIPDQPSTGFLNIAVPAPNPPAGSGRLRPARPHR